MCRIMAELHRGKLAIVTLQRTYKGMDLRETPGDRQGSSTVDKIKTDSHLSLHEHQDINESNGSIMTVSPASTRPLSCSKTM